MKTIVKTLLLPLVSLVPLTAYASSYADDFIIQRDITTGLEYHIYVNGPNEIGERSGTATAAIPVGESGATLELYGVGLAPDTRLYLLAQTAISPYLPVATISLRSADPYEVTRTRADEPIIGEMSFSGLLDHVDAPEAAKRLYFERVAVEYPEGDDRIPMNGATNERVVESFYIDDNGALAGVHETRLTSEFDDHQNGQEIYRVYALPDADLGWTVLAEETVQIWPVADAEFVGIQDGDVIQTSIPDITINMTNLYPTSLTYLQIYKGEQVLGTRGTMIESTRTLFNTIVPQDKSITVTDWKDYLEEDGVYTLELVTVTPFNESEPERVTWATFTLDRTIDVKASISTVK